MSKQGWFRESQRHSLASRGIKTSSPIQTRVDIPQTFIETVNWDLTTTDLPTFDDSIKHPDSPHRQFDCELRWLTPDEFIELQKLSIARFYKNTNRVQERSTNEMFWSGYYPDHGKKVHQYMTSGEPIPSFVIEIDDQGITSFQEGRHRIIVAKNMGIERVPVWFCTRRYS